DVAMLSNMRQEIAAAEQAQAAQPEIVEEVSVEEIETPGLEAPPTEPPAPEPQPGVLDALVNDLESSLGDGFLATPAVAEPSPEAAPAAAVEFAEAATEPAVAETGVLGDFVADLEASLGDSFLPEAPAPVAEVTPPPRPEPAPVAQAAPAPVAPPMPRPVVTGGAAAAAAPALEPTAPAAAAPTFTYQPTKMRQLGTPAPAAAPKLDASAGVDLADMFGELKQELEEETTGTDEDPETHYNLGVAFREM